MTDVLVDRVDGLPAQHGVGADDEVGDGKGFADIVGKPARGGVERKVASLCRLVELRLDTMHRQGFEEPLIGG